ncbi:GNAT family N-acetyltransferase [Empedobacter falsenii]|uniref:GNAT family N-acetyltransferase n=1 Tax=Empedobacter stercoris TaxID=1628248 RepID=A0ABX1WK27_9FLAO|nr:GNAT family N-acetyltransferase [Empedobacter stercoris]NOJ75038.1 GNAT family N-acetyltransferase [Empedobacter stercoris]HJD86015.1 GNAT family N-acetyltransferase [Empedobacter falsenii]
MDEIIWHFKSFEELTSKELYKIIQLRNDVFVIEQDCIYQDADGKDFKCGHLWATIQDEVVAYSRIVPQGISYENEPSIGRVITNPKFRRYGLGKQLMKNSVQVIENQFKTSSIRISAQSYLKEFYSTFGFKQVSEEYLEDDIPHIEMLRK